METPNGTLSPMEKAAIEAHELLDDSDEGLSFYNIFKAGVEWQREHVWHDVSENPSLGDIVHKKEMLFLFEDGHWAAYDSCHFPWVKLLKGASKWAFLTDLLPAR